MCGRQKSAHDSNIAREENSSEQWTPERCTRLLPTNAYGEIDFLGQGRQTKRVPVSLTFFHYTHSCLLNIYLSVHTPEHVVHTRNM